MNLLELPKEIVLLISSFETFEDVLICMSVSKVFYAICHDNYLWKQFLEKSQYKPFTTDCLKDYKSNYVLEQFCSKNNFKWQSLLYDENHNLMIKQLTTIPKELGLLTQLQSLNLCYNYLSTLPNELGQLTNLKKLNLSFNYELKIPKELAQLTKLETLDLSYNKDIVIPEELGQLTNLKNLALFNSYPVNIPQSVLNLKSYGCHISLKKLK